MVEDKEKKYIYISFGIAAILLLIALFFIWSPLFDDKKSIKDSLQFLKEYNENSYVEKMTEEYKKISLSLVNIDNFDTLLKEKLNQNYLEKHNITNDNAKDYLIKNDILKHPSNSTIIYLSNIKEDGKRYIYSYKYKIGNDEKYIHIIENYYRNYTVSFEQDEYPVLDDTIFEVENSQIKFYVKNTSSYDNSVIMNITIENNSTEEYTFDFNSNLNAAIILNDGTKCYLDSLIIGNESSEIYTKPGSKNNINLSFNVKLENQGDISGIDFYNVKKSDLSFTNISISWK